MNDSLLAASGMSEIRLRELSNRMVQSANFGPDVGGGWLGSAGDQEAQ